jgi:cytochrome c oxidase subunit 3
MDNEALPTAEAHPSFLAHHFATPARQMQAAKLGIWLFLATELLMFSGLFCAYAVYRGRHPEIFILAGRFLNWKLGALNTIVLLCSSLTMALAVRSAQRNQTRALPLLLAATLFCGVIFLGVKGVEYHEKWQHHLLPGPAFHPENAQSVPEKPAAPQAAMTAADKAAKTPPPPEGGPGGAFQIEAYSGPLASQGPQGLAQRKAGSAPPPEEKLPEYAHIFFSIYFLMTGLHALHVMGGLGLLSWLIWRAQRRHFSAAYNTPVDVVGLYWHFVDIIWIYLFPLLYLIR